MIDDLVSELDRFSKGKIFVAKGNLEYEFDNSTYKLNLKTRNTSITMDSQSALTPYAAKKELLLKSQKGVLADLKEDMHALFERYNESSKISNFSNYREYRLEGTVNGINIDTAMFNHYSFLLKQSVATFEVANQFRHFNSELEMKDSLAHEQSSYKHNELIAEQFHDISKTYISELNTFHKLSRKNLMPDISIKLSHTINDLYSKIVFNNHNYSKGILKLFK